MDDHFILKILWEYHFNYFSVCTPHTVLVAAINHVNNDKGFTFNFTCDNISTANVLISNLPFFSPWMHRSIHNTFCTSCTPSCLYENRLTPVLRELPNKLHKLKFYIYALIHSAQKYKNVFKTAYHQVICPSL